MTNKGYKGYAGDKGENIVGRYLAGKGYTLLREKYRSPFGEIDLVAQDGGYTVFIEVKYRRTPRYGMPCEAVDVRKQKNMRQAALHYMAAHADEMCDRDCRFDVVTLFGWDSMRVEHIENAF